MASCDLDGTRFHRKYRAVPLRKEDAKAISAVYREVWLNASEYPKEWRERRAISEEEIKKEMDAGYFFFGVHIDGKLAGVYKASLTERGCYGEHQAVLPEYREQGVAYAMYEQFLEFGRANQCRVNYVNILAGNKPCERAMKQYHFYKTGELWEQSPGMWVQTYERKVDDGG
ncbi:MAG: GNAT family N-acetyltransferase [Methanophagales archaeon ANME-1-THS]|nr:MAG: GNAT family N-acetyltransferase [Methanophagales archaeon ANME-1-THS]